MICITNNLHAGFLFFPNPTAISAQILTTRKIHLSSVKMKHSGSQVSWLMWQLFSML